MPPFPAAVRAHLYLPLLGAERQHSPVQSFHLPTPKVTLT